MNQEYPILSSYNDNTFAEYFVFKDWPALWESFVPIFSRKTDLIFFILSFYFERLTFSIQVERISSPLKVIQYNLSWITVSRFLFCRMKIKV